MRTIIALIIIAAILLLLLILLFSPLQINFSVDREFSIKIKLLIFTLFSTKESTSEAVEQVEDEAEKGIEKVENLFEKLKSKIGFTGAVKQLGTLASDMMKRLKWLGRRIYIRHFALDIVVAADNAADTAVRYGAVCTAVYPAVSALCGFAQVKLDRVNVSGNFESEESSFKLSASVRLRVIYIPKALWGAYKEYQNFMIRNELA